MASGLGARFMFGERFRPAGFTCDSLVRSAGAEGPSLSYTKTLTQFRSLLQRAEGGVPNSVETGGGGRGRLSDAVGLKGVYAGTDDDFRCRNSIQHRCPSPARVRGVECMGNRMP